MAPAGTIHTPLLPRGRALAQRRCALVARLLAMAVFAMTGRLNTQGSTTLNDARLQYHQPLGKSGSSGDASAVMSANEMNRPSQPPEYQIPISTCS
jgi:hypothetical protein